MEKTIIIFCLFFAISCSEKKESKSDKNTIKNESLDPKKPKGFCANLSVLDEFQIKPSTIVHWMYMDDSLKNICRPLNLSLPNMASDIITVPEMIMPELLNLTPLKNFEVISKIKVELSDSIVCFQYKLAKDYCICEIFRIYKGIPSSKLFDGYEITEQIVCNAKDEFLSNYDFDSIINNVENTQDTTLKYEIHGHEH